MGVIQTGAIYKGFTFDGIDSKTYGVYISGDAVFNAPERDVEMIEIPGRNGAFALDKGRFENITVTYPAGLFGDGEADFAQGISDLRNALASRKGYCRLEDEYNPNEYRLAVYRSGLDVDPAQLKAGEFDIVFDCKPQRYLKSGESAISVTSGNTITNPTLFESRPLIEATGYGELTINGNSIAIENAEIGAVKMAPSETKNLFYKLAVFPYKNGDFLDNADRISIATGSRFHIAIQADETLDGVNDPVITPITPLPGGSAMVSVGTSADGVTPLVSVDVTLGATFYGAGTASTDACDLSIGMLFTSGGITTLETFTATLYIEYKPSLEYFRMSIQPTDTTSAHYAGGTAYFAGASATSSQMISDYPVYIDADIGEAYMQQADDIVSVNAYTTTGPELPVLAAGANSVTYDNTFSSVKITPRWWMV